MDCNLTTYEIISLCLAGATVIFAIVAIGIAIWSSRQATKEVNRLINDTNRATRIQIAVEMNKLDVEKFRLAMHMLELTTKKKRLEASPNPNIDILLEPPIPMQIKLIDEEYDRCNKLYQKIEIIQADMRQALNNI